MKLLLTCMIFTTQAFAFDLSHKDWSSLLKTHTKNSGGQTLVDYKSLKIESTPLDTYLKQLESLTQEEFIDFTKSDQLAFWINAYNAYTIKWVLKHYPIKSIKDTGSLFSSPWSKDFISLLGRKLSLDDIEHETIRKEFRDPRIHAAVNCASLGCPSLVRYAFVGKQIDKQLEESMKNFLENSSKNRVDKKTIKLNQIFKWYENDFKEKDGSLLNYIKRYIPSAKNVEEISYLDYDWKLNDY